MPPSTQTFDWHSFFQQIFAPSGVFMEALWTTVYIAVISMALGTLLGLASALARRSSLRILRLISHLYVLLIRGTPLIVQVFFIYYGAKIFLGFDPFPKSVDLGLFAVNGAVAAGIVSLALNEGAYMSEVIRGGLESIPVGQIEAAKSVGMTRSLTMRRIILPQAARVIVPPFGNEFNGMIKNTSLLAFIGVYEIFFDAELHYSQTFQPAEYFAAVAVWYLLLTGAWSLVQIAIERRLSVSDRGPVTARRGNPLTRTLSARVGASR